MQQQPMKMKSKKFKNTSLINHNLKVIENLVNGKFGVELKVGKNYYDAKNKILIFTYDMGISIKGNLVGMFAFYFGKNASLITYCYSYKDEFKYDQKRVFRCHLFD